MNKVWTVESGEYSDYTINGFFSTKELADEYCEKLNFCGRGATVCENDLDTEESINIRVHQNGHMCVISLVTGEITREYQLQPTIDGKCWRHTCSIPTIRYDHTLISESYADTPERARKLAVEDRQAWIREMALTEVKQITIKEEAESQQRIIRAQWMKDHGIVDANATN